ncbi:MAG: STAS domain-containing protein [Deferribacterota bacterium]|nr:STAS domain-containing protein [Deferribacterota bacterium]
MESKGLFLTEEKKGVVIIYPPSRLDASVSNELKEIIANYISRNIYKLIIDFKNTKLIDSSGLGAIVSKISVCRTHNGDVRLCNISDNIKEVLSITHLDKILKIYNSQTECLSSFTNNV